MSTIAAGKDSTEVTGTWAADPVHSEVSFELVHAGVDTFRGSFRDFTATLEDGVLAGSARVASVDVKDEQLAQHLQSPDFFDAQLHPEIAFRAGELTIKGVTRPVELELTFNGPTTDPFGRERLGVTAEATIDRRDFGIAWNAPNQSGGDYLGNDVRLVARLALVRQEA